jgi:hypothetical protein
MQDPQTFPETIRSQFRRPKAEPVHTLVRVLDGVVLNGAPRRPGDEVAIKATAHDLRDLRVRGCVQLATETPPAWLDEKRNRPSSVACRVLKPWADPRSNEVHMAGDVLELNPLDARLMISSGRMELATAPVAAKAKRAS